MPSILERSTDPFLQQETVERNLNAAVDHITKPVLEADSNPALSHVARDTRFMSPHLGNSVPVRGFLPIENMYDFDHSGYVPYSPYHDKMWNYTYWALANRT